MSALLVLHIDHFKKQQPGQFPTNLIREEVGIYRVPRTLWGVLADTAELEMSKGVAETWACWRPGEAWQKLMQKDPAELWDARGLGGMKAMGGWPHSQSPTTALCGQTATPACTVLCFRAEGSSVDLSTKMAIARCLTLAFAGDRFWGGYSTCHGSMRVINHLGHRPVLRTKWENTSKALWLGHNTQ